MAKLSKAVGAMKRDLRKKRLKNQKEREEGDYDEIIKLEKIINDQMAIINFYRNRSLEIEGIVKKI